MINFTQTDGFKPSRSAMEIIHLRRNFHFDKDGLTLKLKKIKIKANGNQERTTVLHLIDATPNYSDNPYWTINENT
jgi:hypothetical protein